MLRNIHFVWTCAKLKAFHHPTRTFPDTVYNFAFCMALHFYSPTFSRAHILYLILPTSYNNLPYPHVPCAVDITYPFYLLLVCCVPGGTSSSQAGSHVDWETGRGRRKEGHEAERHFSGETTGPSGLFVGSWMLA